MNTFKSLLAATALSALSALAFAAVAADDPAPITKEQAMAMALAEHPGQVTKAYQETKRGKTLWEVKIDGDDGQKWELYYNADTGELVKAKAD